MQHLEVAIAQFNQFWEDRPANLSHFEKHFSQVDFSNTDLLMLPEMFDTGFSMNTEVLGKDDGAETSLTWLKAQAKQLNLCIYTSLLWKSGDRFQNLGVFVRPNGEVETYAKRKTFGLAGEDLHIQSGQHETIVELNGWKLQLQICYDLRFPENCRNRILANNEAAYDAILYVANWPEKRAHHWKSLLVARAIENQSYVLGCNRIGSDMKELTYSGDSGMITELGESHWLEPLQEAIGFYLLDRNLLNETRRNLPFLKDITPDH